MIKIIILSKSLDENCLKSLSVNTSSKKFEKSLAESLVKSRKAKVEVVNINGQYSSKKIGDIGYSSFMSYLNFIKHIVKHERRNTVVITTGYNPVVMIVLNVLRIKGFSVYSYMYDTHKTSLKGMRYVKKLLVDVFFSFGFLLSKNLNGWFVLNDLFIKELNIEISYLKTKVGVEIIKENGNSKTTDRNIVFAGTLNHDNGIDLLISAFKSNQDIQFYLDIYGSGTMLDSVLLAAEEDKRIRYHGLVDNDVLLRALLDASYLISLRAPDSISNSISFPSKLVEFMGTGTQVISNRFPGLDDEYCQCLHIIEDFTEDAVSRTLHNLFLSESKSSKSAKKFVNDNNNWLDIARDILHFLDNRRV